MQAHNQRSRDCKPQSVARRAVCSLLLLPGSCEGCLSGLCPLPPALRFSRQLSCCYLLLLFCLRRGGGCRRPCCLSPCCL